MKTDSRLSWSRCKSAAESSLENVEQYIKTRKSLNWIPDELTSATHWAMQGWIDKKGIEPISGNGWLSVTLQFYECSSKSLKSQASYLLSASAFLENEMFEKELEEWLREADNLLSLGKEFIQALQENLDKSEIEEKNEND